MLRKIPSIVVVCLFAAACAAQAPAATSPAATSPEPQPTVVPIPSPTLPGATAEQLASTYQPAASGPAASGPPDAIAVMMGTCCALRFVPYSLTAEAGTVALFLTNPKGENIPPKSHDIQIGRELGQAMARSPVVKNGEAGLFTIEAMAAGKYVFWCAVDGHDTLGMVGTLTVSP